MKIPFCKYHGTGNDFIIIDDRREIFDINDSLLINQICSRRFGVGADGLILLREEKGFDFKMVYFNSDGKQSSMCGNGGRCIVHYAHTLGLFDDKCMFLAIDGVHEAIILDEGLVKLKMGDVTNITKDQKAFVMNTGSPHYVLKVNDVNKLDIKSEGRLIRYAAPYSEKGINVNFIQSHKNGIYVATYERGVEDETFSCGTGVTASAIAIHELNPSVYPSPVPIQTKGGDLLVYFRKLNKKEYTDIWLQGPAVLTFEGVWRSHI